MKRENANFPAGSLYPGCFVVCCKRSPFSSIKPGDVGFVETVDGEGLATWVSVYFSCRADSDNLVMSLNRLRPLRKEDGRYGLVHVEDHPRPRIVRLDGDCEGSLTGAAFKKGAVAMAINVARHP